LSKKNHAARRGNFLTPPRKTAGQALRAASEKAARMGDRFRICADLVRFYAESPNRFPLQSCAPTKKL
jgi:hypothetical protein